MKRETSRFVVLGSAAITLITCLLLANLVLSRTLSGVAAEAAAKDKLETALGTIPSVPGDVLIVSDSGKTFGGTNACVSYHIEQLHGTNDADITGVLSWYDSTLPSLGWESDLVPADARTFERTGDVHLGIGALSPVYWYDLVPFFSFSDSAQGASPSKTTEAEAKSRFKTVFTVSLTTFPIPRRPECMP